MRFITDLGPFADAVRNAAQGLPANPPVPVLGGMLVSAGKNVTFTAFDGDVMFSSEQVCSADDGCTDVIEEGSAVLPGKVFADIVRNLSGDHVDFHLEGSDAFLHASRAKFRLNTMDVRDYPSGHLPAPEQGTAEGLAAGIAKVAPSVSKSPAVPAFTCILAEPDGDELVLVASDRARLAMTRVPWTQSAGDRSSALIPGWAAEKFAKAASSGTVAMGWDSQRLSMSCDGLEVIARAMHGEHLKWREMLPDSPGGIVADTAELTEAIRQASLLMNRTDPVLLRFDGNDLRVSGSGERGDCESTLEVEDSKENLTIGFGLGVILDGLAGCGEKVMLSFSGPNKPAKLYSDGFRYLMAPRRSI